MVTNDPKVFRPLTITLSCLAGQQWWAATTHSLLAASSTPPSCSKSNKMLSLLPPPVFAIPSFSPTPSVQCLSSASKLTGLGNPCIPPRLGMSASLCPCSPGPGIYSVQTSFQMPPPTPLPTAL